MLFTFIVLLLLVACSPTRPPVDQLDAASRALGAARDAGASTDAVDDYRAAARRFDEAQAAEARHKYDDAADLAYESQVSSELAAARARQAKERREVTRIEGENANLERGLQRDVSRGEQP